MEKVTRWQLAEGCIFVDAFDFGGNPHPNKQRIPKGPKEPNYAHLICNVLDTEEARKLIRLGDEAGFIMRYIVLGVDTATEIPQIMLSEFPTLFTDAAAAQKKVEELIADVNSIGTILIARQPQVHANDFGVIEETDISKRKKYKLGFDVASYGGGVIKIVR